MIPFLPIATFPPWLHIAALVVYVAVALWVSGDVLLRKRDVRAALGWIAVAWLSPLLGGALYYVFGINRVSRRASRIGKRRQPQAKREAGTTAPKVSENIGRLAEISRRIHEYPLTAGNGIDILHGGGEGYPAMLDAIAGARQSLAFASYIFRNDETADRFIDALIAAHQRGVTVRVLLDSVGSGYIFSHAVRRLRAAGVPVARFLHTWMPWRMPFLNMRNHKKLMIVDGRTGFTGGLNIGRENEPTTDLRDRVDDVHLRINGPAVHDLMDSFASDWSFTTGETLDAALWWPQIAPAGEVYARGIRSGPDADLYKLEMLLGAALAQARKRVRIVTPYFLPDQRLQFALQQAKLRGVKVEILLPQRCDYLFLNWAMNAHLRAFRELPEDVYLSPLPFDHAKLMTVDGEWCLAGSSNWDARSLRLNFEFDLECYDSGLAARLDEVIDARIARSRRLTRADLMEAPRWMRLRDAAVRLMLPYL